MLFPGAFLIITTLAFNLLGDGLRDAFDVRTRTLRALHPVPTTTPRPPTRVEGRRRQQRYEENLRFGCCVAALVALAALAAGCGSKKSSARPHHDPSSGSRARVARRSSKGYDNGSSAKGGTYTVGWEQSFGFTDNFDPTGEYLGEAWGLYTTCSSRTLVGYKHRPAPPATARSATSRPSVPKPTNGGTTYTFHLARASSSARR